MSHRHCSGDCLPDGCFQVCEDLSLEVTFMLSSIKPGILEDSFRRKVAVGRVVLVQSVNRHPAWRRARGPRQRGAKRIVAFIGDTNPIDGAEHNGLAGTQQNNSPRSQTKVPFVRHRIVSHEASDGRSGVDVEDGKTES